MHICIINNDIWHISTYLQFMIIFIAKEWSCKKFINELLITYVWYCVFKNYLIQIYETEEQNFSYLKYEYINDECKNKSWFQMWLRKK